MSEHILYTSEDFKDCPDNDTLYTAVVDGGLNVCKVCGEFEAGLDKPCKPRTKEED